MIVIKYSKVTGTHRIYALQDLLKPAIAIIVAIVYNKRGERHKMSKVQFETRGSMYVTA